MSDSFLDVLRRVRRWPKQLIGRDLNYRPQIRFESDSLGLEGSVWRIRKMPAMHLKSVIYCFGVGTDITFELALIERFGVQVHAFDPTPRSIQWVRSQTLPDDFRFHEWGLADYDGMAMFYPPKNEKHVSYSFVNQPTTAAAVAAPVYRLRTIMEKLGHRSIDLLKMDIEGAEYGVIDDVIRSRIEVRQLLIEFHHRWDSIGISRTDQAIRALNGYGMKIFYESATGTEYSFSAEQLPGGAAYAE